MSKYREPAVADPRTLKPGDQVGCTNGGRTLQLLTCDPHGSVDEIWVGLCNEPGQTGHLWGEPVPAGHTAVDLAGQGWKVIALPQIWARKRIE